MAGDERPKYDLIADDLRTGIEDGTYPVGSLLPPKSALKERYGVAQNTVDHALDVLRQLGMTESRQGVGTFVRSQVADEVSDYNRVMARVDEMAEQIRQLRADVDTLKEQREP